MTQNPKQNRKVIKLTKESQLNALIRNKRDQDFTVLYHSLWDSHSDRLMKDVERWSLKDGEETLYTITSWDLPHAFMAFRATKVPFLVYTSKGRVRKEGYLPRIYDYFNRQPKSVRRNRAF